MKAKHLRVHGHSILTVFTDGPLNAEVLFLSIVLTMLQDTIKSSGSLD